MGQWCQFYDNGWAVFHLHVAIITISFLRTLWHRHTQTHHKHSCLPQFRSVSHSVRLQKCMLAANLSYLNLLSLTCVILLLAAKTGEGMDVECTWGVSIAAANA